MKKLILISLLLSNYSHADVILSVSGKYGPRSETTNQTTVVNKYKKHSTYSSSSSTPTYSEQRDLVPGIKLQYVKTFSIGVGVFTDSTVEIDLGIKL